MIKSMTAYATAQYSTHQLAVSAEIRSYNSRYFDLVLRIPSGYQSLEEKIKEYISGHVIRGRVEIKIQIEMDAADANGFEIDHAKAQSFYAALNQLKDAFGIKSEISMDLFLSPGGIIKPAEITMDTEAVWPSIRDCLQHALEELDAMRKREGDFIAQDLLKRLAHINLQLEQIRAESTGLLDMYQQRLKERISALTGDIVEIDPGRIAQEAAILADRSDISEEIVRAESHLKQFLHMMKSDEPAGRKLNFLLQELHREFNTMGSKIGNAEISHRIIDVKSELEKIREQTHNIE
ncbi:MAG: YicC family protein [Desulfobacterales bacterium]|nr:MAG: YicC family protein [Desulfobacterales bacterium]